MRVLVACEISGVIRDSFRKLGHDAYSCDLKKSPSEFHITDDALHILGEGWDLLIAHPECRYLTVSCSRLWSDPERIPKMEEAAKFFMAMMNAPIPKIAIENPVGAMSKLYRKADQYIQPFEFGDDASKKTGLWLKNLPPLLPTRRVFGRMVEWPKGSGILVERFSNQTDSGQNRLGPYEGRSADRAKTYQGIADAMARQWGS